MDPVNTNQIKQKLLEAGGRFSQDLGLGRIVGQILVYLYLDRDASSLDDIAENLELSKASVSIATRQLEKMGMIVRIWKKGDRKCYYRTADNFVQALQQGVGEFIRQKMQVVGAEIEQAHVLLQAPELKEIQDDPDLCFLNKRVERAMVLKKRVEKVVDNPLVKLMAGITHP